MISSKMILDKGPEIDCLQKKTATDIIGWVYPSQKLNPVHKAKRERIRLPPYSFRLDLIAVYPTAY
jgi:hypothetical protein